MRLIALVLLGSLLGCTPRAVAAEPQLRSGDLVFQTSRSSQSLAIRLATHSPYSHVGIVQVTPHGTFVIEAEGHVQATAWKRWHRRGVDGKYLVLRVRGLSPEQAQSVLRAATALLGRPYDLRFEPGDKALYCSELVETAFSRGAAIRLGKWQRLGELDLSLVGDQLEQRYGTVPADLELITPASIAADPKLEQVYSSF